MSLLGNIWVRLGLKSDDFNRGIDNAERKSKTFGESMKAVAAKVVAVVAALRTLGGVTKIITNFEAAQSRLAAILGTTADKIGDMSEAAIQLGRQTQYTASQVTDLQTELAKLGFAKNDILAMQEGVLKFAAAVGTDLASAAARAGATMRGFGLTAEETEEMLAVMAVSTSKSALSFSYLDSTLGKLVPVTRSYGLDTKATVALLGSLANAGIDASSAGTSLRNILIRLSDANSDLNQKLGKQPKTMEEVLDALVKLRDGHLDLGEAQKLTDARSATVLLSLMNNAEACRDLYTELQNTDGALNQMYTTMTDNVQGAVNELKSAWEAFVLSLSNSKGLLRDMIRLATDVVNVIGGQGSFRQQRARREAQQLIDREYNGGEIGTPAVIKRQIEQLENDLDKFQKEHIHTRTRQIKDELEVLYEALTIAEERAAQKMDEAWRKNFGKGGAGVVADGSGSGSGDGLGDLLRSLKGATDVAAQAREFAQEIADANAYDDEMRKKGAELYKAYKDEIQEVIDYDAEMTAQASELYTALHAGLNPIDQTTESLVAMGEATIATAEKVENMKGVLVEAAYQIGDAFMEGAASGLEYLAEALGSGEWNTADFVKSLVGPLADAAISAGTLILTTGEGLEAVKKAFESLNGYAAIAAGAALVGLGLALKTGMAALSRGGSASSGSTYTNPYTYAGGYGAAPVAGYGASIDVNVSGVLKGQDIYLSSEEYKRNRGR